MVRVKQCCCGCSLRTGSIILLWFSLISCCLGIFVLVSNIPQLFIQKVDDNVLVLYCYVYMLINCIIGIVLNGRGIHGINQNLPQYLNGAYYFMWNCIVHSVIVGVLVFTFLLIVESIIEAFIESIFFSLSGQASNSSQKKSLNINLEAFLSSYMLIMLLTFAVCISVLIYFAIVIKSLRDSMREQKYIGNYSYAPTAGNLQKV